MFNLLYDLEDEYTVFNKLYGIFEVKSLQFRDYFMLFKSQELVIF